MCYLKLSAIMCLPVFHNGRVAQNVMQKQDRSSRSTLQGDDEKPYKRILCLKEGG